MQKEIRLDKLLCDMGFGSRSEVKKAIQYRRVWVDGKPAKSGDVKIKLSSQPVITWDRQPVVYRPYLYLMLNKPKGVVSATSDHHQKTVMDLILREGMRRDLFPVGRLDVDTEGLLLITNDGALAHELLSPKKHVDKTYYVEVENSIPTNAKELFAGGLSLPAVEGADAFTALPAEMQQLSETKAMLTLQEGKFHQVKRMFAEVGCPVTYLKRVRMGNLELDQDLQPGMWRELTEDELQGLKKESGLC